MIKLQPEVKQKWVKALRSGKYKQTQENLYKNDKFCCLGVLAMECGRKNLELDDITDEPELHSAFVNNKIMDTMNSLIPSSNEKVQNYLIGLNDENRHSFKKIANWIDKNL